ncbi:putative entry exclusion protein TrbK-alt [Bradyrhizobium diazoefficiens]|uniref:putative entry exclusion protein TrbK-alt n=1 Tax=Bradyrhizobium diazoefficiens TaxID=1355477 RepID=UPI00190AC282|nr:putative entry exclusion protein TrbK-alt [Bradyrhizobium diazoefficiens]MBK3662675.1 putative entry exclusion protein TrbK-alt [Bradyrhizobium diazoefficiens]
MSDQKAFQAVSLTITVIAGAALIVACTIQLRGPDKIMGSKPSSIAASRPMESDLTRCRTVTSEHSPAYQDCQRIWAENRRRFFRPGMSSISPAANDRAGSPVLSAPKDQSRMPQGDSSVASPEGGNQ